MKIALIAHYLGPKLGIGQYLDRLIPPLCKELASKGYQFVILSSPNAFKNSIELQKINDIYQGSIETLPALDYSPAKRYFWFATKFNGYCRQLKITSVLWLSNPLILPWHPSSIAVLHDVNEWKDKDKYGSSLKTTLRSWVYLDTSILCAKKIILISQATKSDLVKFRPRQNRSGKLEVISNGSDSQLVNQPFTEVPAPSSPFLLSVGRIDPDAKRLPDAVNLVKILRDVSEQSWELHLVGGMNKSTQALGEAFLKEVESISWVYYHGHVDDRALAAWYRKTNGVVFLSENEGFGFPIAEAASFNKWSIVNHKNKAAIEAGQSSLIQVNLDSPELCAHQIIDTLTTAKPQETNLPTWQDAAIHYADVVLKLLNKQS